MKAAPPAPRRPVRVLLVSPTFGAYGGMEAFVLAVADTLAQDSRFDVRVLFKRTTQFGRQPDFEQQCRPFPVEFCGRASHTLWSAIAWADIVHGQNASPDVAAMAFVLRRPIVLTVHNTLPDRPALRRLAWWLAARTAAARWYNSSFVRSTWEGHRARGESVVVPTTSRLPAGHVDPLSRRGFAFLGRLVAGKGADILIDAYRASGLDPDVWPLTIMGEGPLRARLEDECARRGIRGVTFAGFVAGAAKAHALARAKWLVAPSHWREPFGLVAIEARSVGVPCIIAADGGLPEAGGRDALVCVPGDVGSLARRLVDAANMPDVEYLARARRTRDDLDRELVPTSFYGDAYLRLVKEARR
jgi:glycosyltransferase involved in cell wall biosynthesis